MVVRGGADYKRLLPHGTYINTADFKSFKRLVKYLKQVGSTCSSAMYNTHLYRLAVQASFDSDAVECWISTQEILVRSSAGAKR